MLNIHVKDKAILISDAIMQSANISESDELSIRYKDGVIMLVREDKRVSNEVHTKAKHTLLDFAGATKGLYGKNTQERQAYLQSERQSWEKK